MGTDEETAEKSWQETVEDIFDDFYVFVDWCDGINDASYADCEFYSPAGEDFVFRLNADSYEAFREDLNDYHANFDPEKHAAEWYGENRGEPSSLRVLLDDADNIDYTLEELCCALH